MRQENGPHLRHIDVDETAIFLKTFSLVLFEFALIIGVGSTTTVTVLR